MDERLYWIGFNLVKGIGAVRFRSILDHFGDAKSAWDASPAELTEASLGGKVIERFVELRSTLDLENYRDQIHKQGIQVLIWPDAAYPTQLMEIEQPPPVLYIRGEITHEDRWAVAIVGTLITGEFAVEQGREVFAVPGNILAPQSKGCNKLIANGARPMLNAQDVLEALDLTETSNAGKSARQSPRMPRKRRCWKYSTWSLYMWTTSAHRAVCRSNGSPLP